MPSWYKVISLAAPSIALAESGNRISSVPVGTVNTVPSASFFNVTSLVEPCPVKISPSALVYPIAALSPEEVSAFGSIVVPIITPVEVIAPEPIVPNPLTFPLVSKV